MGKSYAAHDEACGDECIKYHVESVPEPDVVSSDLPQFGYLIADESEGEDVEKHLRWSIRYWDLCRVSGDLLRRCQGHQFC